MINLEGMAVTHPAQEKVGLKPVEMMSEKEREIARLTDRLAEELLSYSLELQPNDTLVILLHPLGAYISEAVRVKAEEFFAQNNGTGRILIQQVNPDIDKMMMESMDKEDFSLPRATDVQEVTDTNMDDVSAFLTYGIVAERREILRQPNTKVLILANKYTQQTEMVNGQPVKVTYDVEQKIQNLFDTLMKDYVAERRASRWCLVSVLSEEQAATSGMSLEDLKLFYLHACDRPWQKVEEAQAILCDKLANQEMIEVYVPAPEGKDVRWTTHLTLSTENQTMVNSVAKRNMPGSEAFTGPKRHSVNGTYAIPYAFPFNERILSNGIFHIENGAVTSFEADNPDDVAYVEQLFASDPGMREVGEFAVGTNPNVSKPVTVTILVEKMLGIHLAFGSAYEMTNYLGTPVKTDNGVRANHHIDVARGMTLEWGGGLIKAGDEVIFRDGIFVDPRLAVLNAQGADKQNEPDQV